MQTGSGPYRVPEHYALQRQPPPHMFTLTQHDLAIPPPHHHLQQQQQQQQHHPQPHHHQQQQQQQQQHHHQQHLPHSQHAQHGQHPQHQPQPPQQHPQHAQHPHQQQHAQHQPHPHQQQQQQQQQQQMVQQLGLGPDSPEVPSPVTSRLSPTSFKPETLGDDEGPEEGRGTGGNRWPRQETLALIKIRSEMDSNFRDSGLKGPLWEDVSRKMGELGYRRSSKKCKEKFENVHKYYKKTKDGRAGRQDGKSYRFFSQLEALYGGGGGSGSQHGSHGGTGMLPAGSGAAIGGGAEGNLSLQRPGDSSGLQLSSDSEGDYDDPVDNDDEQEKPGKRKRKDRNVLSKILHFESLLKKLLEKQEAMHRKLLDAMERKEQDRLVREESWKRQESARLNREHELRAQEHARSATRDAALVAFLQKATGQTVTLPPIAPPQAVSLNTAPESHHVEEHQEKETFDPNSKRWPKPEVQALIRLRSEMEPRFQEAGPKGPLWEEISTGMACLGFSRNAKRCKEKWENINKYFRKTKETNKKRPDNAKTCPYFHQLDMLYRKGVLGNPSSKHSKVEETSDELMDHQNSREDTEQDHGRDGEETALAISAADGPSGTSTSNGGATHFFSSPGNGSNGERGSKKVMKPHILSNPTHGDHSSDLIVQLNFDPKHGGDDENFSGNNKPVRLEGSVNSMIEKDQNSSLDDVFDGEPERKLRKEQKLIEQETGQQQEYRVGQEHGSMPSQDFAVLALVQKVGGRRADSVCPIYTVQFRVNFSSVIHEVAVVVLSGSAVLHRAYTYILTSRPRKASGRTTVSL